MAEKGAKFGQPKISMLKPYVETQPDGKRVKKFYETRSPEHLAAGGFQRQFQNGRKLELARRTAEKKEQNDD